MILHPAPGLALLLLCVAQPALALPPSTTAQKAGMYQPDDDLTLKPLTLSDKIARKTTGLFSNRPSEKTVTAQMELARRKDQAHNLSGAAGAYDALVRRWPYAVEAAAAQKRLAELQEARGKYKRAFEAYRYLVNFYAEQISLEEILPRMFAIANYYRARGKGDSGLLMFQQIAEFAPQWKRTPEALLQVGLLQVQAKDWYAAVATFERITANYPGTSEAETASAQTAHVLYRLSQRFTEDEAIQLRALAALTATLRDYPDHVDRAQLQEQMTELVERRYTRHFNMAKFYDNARFKPETALAAYADFVRRFPNAPQAEMARRRIEALSNTVKQ